jgi:hypothetical protein
VVFCGAVATASYFLGEHGFVAFAESGVDGYVEAGGERSDRLSRPQAFPGCASSGVDRGGTGQAGTG